MHNNGIETEKERDATKQQLEKIKKLEGSVSAIDSRYFEYNKDFKKHVLKIDVEFPVKSSDMNAINMTQKILLKNAGKRIEEFIDSVYNIYNSPFLVVVEGQSSKGPYWKSIHENNDVLSYERAFALVEYWEKEGIALRSSKYAKKCELLVCGSGDKGVMRVQPDIPSNSKNQRFLIHIIPKPGMVEDEINIK